MYKVLVIGLGKIALGYDLASCAQCVLTHTKAYILDERFELTGGIDPNPQRRAEFVAFSEKPAWPTLDEFLASRNRDSIDIVSICTPTELRNKIVYQVLDGLKPKVIFLEKPIASTIEEAQGIKDACKKKNATLIVNYTRRLLPAFQGVAGKVRNGEYGTLNTIHVYYSNGLLDNGSHFLNLLPLFVKGHPLVAWAGEPTKTHDRDDIDVSFFLKWGETDVFFQAINSKSYDIGEMDFLCSAGRIIFRDYGSKMELWVSESDPKFPQYGHLVRKLREDRFIPDNPLALALRSVLGHMDEIAPNTSDMDSAIETLALCKMIKDLAIR